MTANYELHIPTFDKRNADILNRFHSEFERDNQLLVSQVEVSGDVTNSPTDLTSWYENSFTTLPANRSENS